MLIINAWLVGHVKGLLGVTLRPQFRPTLGPSLGLTLRLRVNHSVNATNSSPINGHVKPIL